MHIQGYFIAKNSFVAEVTFKVLCNLQSEKIWVVVLQIYTCLQKTTTCTGLKAEQIFSVKVQYLYFFNLGSGFCDFFSILFPEAPASCGKKILKYFFLHCTSIYITSKIVSQIFNILLQTDNIILSFKISFLVDLFN